MTHEEVEARLAEAKREDGTFEESIIGEMNEKGVFFTFTPYGVSYKFETKRIDNDTYPSSG